METAPVATASATVSPAAMKPGKASQSVGHMAKAAVADARAAGVELPGNALGKAASAIAQGADPALVFAAKVAALAPDVGQPLVETAISDAPTEAEAGYADAASVLTPPATEDDIALQLLTA